MHVTRIRRLLALAVCLALVALGALVGAGPAAAQLEDPRPLKIVQIGDSYSAGNGAGNYYGPKDCYRSSSNWAWLYVQELRAAGYHVTFVNRACSGAVSGDLVSPRRMDDSQGVGFPVAAGTDPDDPAVVAQLQSLCPRPTYPEEEYYQLENIRVEGFGGAAQARADCRRYLPAQADAVGLDTDLVLLTVGGNDIGFEDIIKQCFAIGFRDPGSCRDRVESGQGGLEGVQSRLSELLTRLGSDVLRPDAKIGLLAYPYLSNREHWDLRSVRRIISPFGGGDSYDAGFGVRELGRAGDEAQAAAVAEAEDAVGRDFVTYVDTVKPHFAGHEPDPRASNRNPDRWIHEFDSRIVAEWYHPNARGHVEEKNLLLPHGDFAAGQAPPEDDGDDLDLVLAFETTEASAVALDGFKAIASALVDRMEQDTSSHRIGIVSYRDHPETSGNPDDYPARVDLELTDDPDAIRAAIDGLQAGGGAGLGQATVFSGLVAGFDQPFRPGVRKEVLQLGVSQPYSPEPVSGLTLNDVVARSLQVDPVAVLPVLAGGDDLAEELTEIAERTGGFLTRSLPEDAGTDALAALVESLERPFAWVGGPYVAAVGSAVELDASGSFDPQDGLDPAEITLYEWDFDGDGEYDRATTDPLVTHTYGGQVAGSVVVRVTGTDGTTSIGSAHLAVTRDGDEVPDAEDNCPDDPNPDQGDIDGDGTGNACGDAPLLPTEDLEGVFDPLEPGPIGSSLLSGAVFADANEDGVRQAGEAGIEGVRIDVSGIDAGGDPVFRNVTTDDDGDWSVANLIPGTYAIAEVQPTDVPDGPDSLGIVENGASGASAGVLGDDAVTGVVLSGQGSRAVGYGFGEAVLAPTPTPTPTPTVTGSPSPSPTGGVSASPPGTPAVPGLPDPRPSSGALAASGAEALGLAGLASAVLLTGVLATVVARRRNGPGGA
ncbi:GDSL-type esterase/lipase family protein [Cellulomonas sp. NPDC055163]